MSRPLPDLSGSEANQPTANSLPASLSHEPAPPNQAFCQGVATRLSAARSSLLLLFVHAWRPRLGVKSMLSVLEMRDEGPAPASAHRSQASPRPSLIASPASAAPTSRWWREEAGRGPHPALIHAINNRSVPTERKASSSPVTLHQTPRPIVSGPRLPSGSSALFSPRERCAPARAPAASCRT